MERENQTICDVRSVFAATAQPRRSRMAERGSCARWYLVGGGIGGLAAGIALRRVGIEASAFEKAPEITEVGAGLSLWSNAVLAARQLGVEAEIVAAGSVFDKSRSYLPSAAAIDEFDFAGNRRKAGAPTLCMHCADLQRILLDAALARDPDAVRTGRECIGWKRKTAASLRCSRTDHGNAATS